MAHIFFYDTTEIDKEQLSTAFAGTDHLLEFNLDKIEPKNCNPEAEVVSVFVSSNVTREVIEAMPKLKLISCRSAGFNNVDLEAAEERGITVVNVPAYGEATVAEYAFALLLALERKLSLVFKTENEKFSFKDLTGHDLEGRVFGVIGTGRIGQKALKIASGFSMKTIAYDVHPNEKLQDECHFKYVTLDELLAQSDVVSLHVPYLPSTHHLINRERLYKMKRGAVLVNTARGELVDTSALIELLDSGYLSGAAIDVIEGEALLNYKEETALLRSHTLPEEVLRHSVEISILKKMPNVVISPHNAFNTVQALERINGTTHQNIVSFYAGKIQNKVSLPVPGKLILLRHAESEWNAKGIWTGKTDIGLSEKGKKQCLQMGLVLKNLGMDINVACHTSLSRSKETLDGVCDVIDANKFVTICEDGFTERDYGEFTGKNKWQIRDELGESQFNKLRRGWDEHIPNGETLKDVYARVVPAYKTKILPYLLEGKNVLLVAHGNSLRAMIKYLDSISDEGIESVEMPWDQLFVYEINPTSGLKKTVRVIEVSSDSQKIN